MASKMRSKVDYLRTQASQKKASTQHAFSSWSAFKSWVQVHDTALDEHGHREAGPTWSNEDLDPTPIEKRTWRW